MLTLFTTPKPFLGSSAVIQRNAFASWARLDPAPRILVFGDEPGAADAAARIGAVHVPEVGCNDHGTPLVSALFEAAERLSNSPLLCYVNADIILLSDMSAAVRRIATLGRCLVVGRRWDLDIPELWDFTAPEWEARLRQRVREAGGLHSVMGLDYFLYPRGFWGALPPFAIGRSGWDNWLIYRARALGAPVIDATHVVTAIHQNHDYGHHPQGEAGVWHGEEARRNQGILGGARYAFTLADATHVLTPSGLRRALSMTQLKRRLVTAPLFHPGLEPIIAPVVNLAKAVRALAYRTAQSAKSSGSSRE